MPRIDSEDLLSQWPLAPICRSRDGANMPIMDWLQYADPKVAPIWRSVTVSA
jgi:hypothetical protein